MRFSRYALPCLAVAATLAMSSVAASAADENYLVVGDKIPEYLSGAPGDPANGRKIVVHRRKGMCLACHSLPAPEHPFHGETGPDLAGVGSRMTEGEIRMRMVDPKVINPDTMMPSFYRTKGLHRVLKKWQGKTVLTAKEVDDVVAYLMTLKDE